MIKAQQTDAEWGQFMQPDPEHEKAENLIETFGIKMPSGHQSNLDAYVPHSNLIFSQLVSKLNQQKANIAYEDQCTAKYYFDNFNLVQNFHKEFNRIVDVGVYLGGSANLFAGCLQPFNLELDLVDVNKKFLRFTYERIRRTFPESIGKVRMFFGDLPTYVKNVMQKENSKSLIHHDGSHNFNEVVKDLASLYYVKDKIHALSIQDTHLRSAKLNLYTFVDAAVYAVFGYQMQYIETGFKFPNGTNPAFAYSTYFLPNQTEGMYIPFAGNTFRYPHPSMTLDDLFAATA